MQGPGWHYRQRTPIDMTDQRARFLANLGAELAIIVTGVLIALGTQSRTQYWVDQP